MIGLTGTQSRGTPLGGSWPHPVRVHAQGWQNRGSRRTARSVLLAPRSIVEGNTRPANREWSTWHPKQSGTPILKTSIASSKNDDGSAADDDPSIGSDERAMPPVGDPVGVVAWGGKLPSTRRMVVGGLAGVSIGETIMAAVRSHSSTKLDQAVADGGGPCILICHQMRDAKTRMRSPCHWFLSFQHYKSKHVQQQSSHRPLCPRPWHHQLL